jgi:hypothetical protein
MNGTRLWSLRENQNEPQISPLRLASVEMTILWRDEIPRFQETLSFVIPRVCNFISFLKNSALKTKGLSVSKTRKSQ